MLKKILELIKIIKLNFNLIELKLSINHLLSDQNKIIQINNHLLDDQKKIHSQNQQILNDSAIQQKYLKEKGWYLSVKNQQSINFNNEPIPWYTYPSINFAERILKLNHNIFEFGCGNSSLWFSSRCATIKSVEHDNKWSTHIASKAPSNLNICYRPRFISRKYTAELAILIDEYFALFPDPKYTEENESYGLISKPYINYCAEIFNDNIQYDIIVIDSIARGLSSYLAIHRLAENGFIIFDNSDWIQYDWLLNYLKSQGFERIDFYGAGPQNNYEWCTSFLSKRFNNLYR